MKEAQFLSFLEDLLRALGIEPKPFGAERESEIARSFLDRLNRHMYQECPVGDRRYISEFHRFWESHHEDVIGPTIDLGQARKVAQALESVFANPEGFTGYVLKPPIDRTGISDQAVANVRFFTAIQDFKVDIYKGGRNPFRQYQLTPSWFTASQITQAPGELMWQFLQWLGATGSQGDKRYGWMVAAAEFLVSGYGGDAYRLLGGHGSDALAIRQTLAGSGDIGYSEKKADMFLRDMADWGIWSFSRNFDRVDVASDANTMRIALRTGILCTKLLLIASYLDVYGYQYTLIDRFTRLAWRAVWEQWKQIPANHCPATPASLDYVLYRSIGRRLCKPRHPKCTQCVFGEVCPPECRVVRSPRSISRLGQTGWESGRTDQGGGGGIVS